MQAISPPAAQGHFHGPARLELGGLWPFLQLDGVEVGRAGLVSSHGQVCDGPIFQLVGD